MSINIYIYIYIYVGMYVGGKKDGCYRVFILGEEG